MATKHSELFAALASPFDPEEVKVRTQAGRQLHYITARTAMNRLDNVLGPENWWDEYVPQESSVLCRLTIRMPDGSTLTKADAGGYAGMSDSGDDDKSGYSDAFKRACVKFGVARYLYRDGVPSFVTATPPAPVAGDEQRGGRGGGNGQVPESGNRTQSSNGNGHHAGNGNGNGNVPRSGKALFAWTKDQEHRYEVGLLHYLNNWAKLQDWPSRMIEWDAEQVGLAYAEACRKLQAVQARDAYERE